MAFYESRPLYSIVIAVHPEDVSCETFTTGARVGDITVDWVDFTRDKSTDRPPSPQTRTMTGSTSRRKPAQNKIVPGSASPIATSLTSSKPDTHRRRHDSPSVAYPTPDALSLQPLLGHFPGPNPLDTSAASGLTTVGRGVVHLFRHAPPPPLIASLDAHPVGESSSSPNKNTGEWAGERAEGEDGSLVAILAVPAWMRPADFLEFIGGWTTCLEGVRMIR